MKKTLNIFCIIATILIIVGALFKFMHWPGAGPFLILSMGLLSLGFIPVYAKTKMAELNGWKIKFIVGLGYFCLSLLNLGFLFKIMHWPGAGPLLVFSMGIFGLFFLPAYSIHKMRHSVNKAEKIMNISGGISLSFIILGLLFKLQHWPFCNELLILGVILLLTLCLPFLLKAYKNDPERKTATLVRLTFISVMATTLIAFMFGNASKMFMNSFALTQEKLEESSRNINARNENLLISLEKDNSVKPKAEKVRELSNDLCSYIFDMKSHLVSANENMSKEDADSLSPYAIQAKDNYDISTRILIGELENPKEGAFSGNELRNKITVFREDMLGMISVEQRSKVEKTLGLTLSDTFDTEFQSITKWEVNNFYNVPISGVLNILSQLQNTIRLAENDILNSLKDEATNAAKTETIK